jgi:phosphoglycolate phosphatase
VAADVDNVSTSFPASSRVAFDSMSLGTDDYRMNESTRELLSLFFDLDGTLSDPSEGITRCIQHALQCLGRPFPPRSELVQFIGPPLRWTFPRLLGTDDPVLVNAAVDYYRQRFGEVGLFENEVYPGVPELLGRLHEAGYPLYVVTSKPKIYADRIIRHFGFERFFVEVYGPELNGRFDEKTELVGFILRQLGRSPRQTVMIGDRARDIESGRAHGTRTIGVTYGFGSLEEMTAAGADRICRSPREIYPTVQEIRG